MNKIFATLHMTYVVIAIILAITSFGNISISAFISGILAPIIAWFGGSGLRGSFNVGDKKQKITGFIAGVIFVAISLFWTNYTNYFVRITDLEMSGPIWCFIGFLVGLLFSTKKHSENNFN